jgi:hypothetical protein
MEQSERECRATWLRDGLVTMAIKLESSARNEGRNGEDWECHERAADRQFKALRRLADALRQMATE